MATSTSRSSRDHGTRRLAAAAAVAALGCSADPLPGDAAAAGTDLGGQTLHNAYGHALANLVGDHWLDLRQGKALFLTTWVAPGEAAAERKLRGPASQVRDGLGPLFNERSCQDCHYRDGRGRPMEDGRPRRSLAPARSGPPRLLRLGGVGREGQLAPEPRYGGQLQDRALAPVVADGDFELGFRLVAGSYPDGTPFLLEAPVITVGALRDGPLDPATPLSVRIPPSLIGLGLLEAIPEAAIVARADPDDADHDGISGRPNRVRDPQTGARVLGRFGWKAGQPSLWLQNATALREDLGVTTQVFPEPVCPVRDPGCAPGGVAGAPELDDADLERLTRYTRLLGPPARRGLADPIASRGEALFAQLGCAGCHTPRFVTGAVADLPELAHQAVAPYSDLLLHDLGDGLADHRPEADASGREWRTAPLWGLGLLRAVSGEVRLLHDGRARSPEQAILWHGGEAQTARDRFARATRDERAALLRFLDAL
jgi:CxxC motif-containing protein (DUF1111 family)